MILYVSKSDSHVSKENEELGYVPVEGKRRKSFKGEGWYSRSLSDVLSGTTLNPFPFELGPL